ncbi:MAG: hypothetical protein AAGA62_17165, partial [Bacteroidota bacterium]
VRKQLGEYPYGEVRLYEIPRYHAPLHVFPNGIAINELDGWIADTAAAKERGYLLLKVTAGAARHWVMENLTVANVRGADMLTVALPEAIALLNVQEIYGAAAIDPLREAKEKIYNKDRHSDPNGEPALVDADGKDYLEVNHGALMLYDWSQEVGPETFYRLTRELAGEKPAVFADFLDKLLDATPANRQGYWRDIFSGQ